MKAVILAAGKSTRTYPLTLYKPKPLLKVANRPLMEHSLRRLVGLVDEVIIIVGYEAEQIKQQFGSTFENITLTYVEQKHQLGTGHAVLQAKGHVSGKFIVMMGDDMYSKEDLKRLVAHDLGILGFNVEDVSQFGAIFHKNFQLQQIKEKYKGKDSTLANTGLYVVDEKIFDHLEKAKKSTRGEIEFTDAISGLAKKEKVMVELAHIWVPVSYPWSMLEANEALLKRLKKSNNGKVEKGATIIGSVSIGHNTVVKAGAYIEGPVMIGESCEIGPNCYIRPSTTIGDHCKIGNAVEVKNSILMDHVTVSHLSYVGDSIIGEHSNIAGGFIATNWRHDEKPVSSMVNKKLVSTNRTKFGCVIGTNVKTGARTTVYPGRKIWPFKTTLPGEIVQKDIM